MVAGSPLEIPVGANTLLWMYGGHPALPSPGFETSHIATTPVPPSPAFLSLGENKERSSSSKNQKLNHLLGVQGLTKQNIFHKVNHTSLCLGELLLLLFSIHCIITAVCSLSSRLPTFLLSLPLSSKQCSHLVDGGEALEAWCVNQNEKQTRTTANHPLLVISEPEWSFPILFSYFSSLLGWSSMYADAGPGGWRSKYGEARTCLHRVQTREEAVLSPHFILRTAPESMTLTLEVTRAAAEFLRKAETPRKDKSPILCMICCLLSLIWWRLSAQDTWESLYLKCLGVFPRNLYKPLASSILCHKAQSFKKHF